MRLPGKRVSHLCLYDYVLSMASYLILTTVYLGDNVDSYFTEGEIGFRYQTNCLKVIHIVSGRGGVCIQTLFQRH